MTMLDPNTNVGTEIRGRRYNIKLARMRAFSGGPFEMEGWPLINMHTDLAYAKSSGLEICNASGTQSQGYILQIMLELFGRRWLSGGSIETKFIRMVNEGDVVQPWVRGVAREVDGDGAKFTFDIGCDNQRGETVLAGSAAGRVPTS